MRSLREPLTQTPAGSSDNVITALLEQRRFFPAIPEWSEL